MNDSSAHVERSDGTSGRRPSETSTLSGERMCTARELADRWKTSSATVLDWWEQGRIPGYRLGGRKGGPVRFLESDIADLEATWRVEARG